MSIERLLDQIQVRFDPQIARAVVSAFRAEPLAWHFLESTPDLEQWLAFASDDLSRWQPGVLALFSLGDSLHEQDLTNLEINLPAEIIDRVTNVFEMTRLTGLEPANLADAALLALHLRNSDAGKARGKHFLMICFLAKVDCRSGRLLSRFFPNLCLILKLPWITWFPHSPQPTQRLWAN